MDMKKLISATLLIPLILFSSLLVAETEDELEKRINNLEINVQVLREQNMSFRNSTVEQINNNELLNIERSSLKKEKLENSLIEEIYKLKLAQATDIYDLKNTFYDYVISIIIGLFAILITLYLILESKITGITETKANEFIQKQRNIEQVDMYSADAISMYDLYEVESDILQLAINKNKDTDEIKARQKYYLDRAITLSEWAKNAADSLPEKEHPKYNLLKGRANNNYICFLLERGDSNDKKQAIDSSQIAYKLSLHEEAGHNWYRWRETFASVLTKWGTTEEKTRAKKVIELLCDNRSLDNLPWKRKIYQKYLKEYSDLNVSDQEVKTSP